MAKGSGLRSTRVVARRTRLSNVIINGIAFSTAFHGLRRAASAGSGGLPCAVIDANARDIFLKSASRLMPPFPWNPVDIRPPIRMASPYSDFSDPMARSGNHREVGCGWCRRGAPGLQTMARAGLQTMARAGLQNVHRGIPRLRMLDPPTPRCRPHEALQSVRRASPRSPCRKPDPAGCSALNC